MPRTVSRSQLSEAVYQEVELPCNESADLLEMVLDKISVALSRGKAIKISTFGSFSVRKKGQRIDRNPKTGDEVSILPRQVLIFRKLQPISHNINAVHLQGDSCYMVFYL